MWYGDEKGRGGRWKITKKVVKLNKVKQKNIRTWQYIDR